MGGREDRSEWTHVWQSLLAAGDDLPEEVTRADLLGKGAEWLDGREDRAEWTYVWQSLLAAGDDLPEDVTRADLLGKGAEWLDGREDRAEWNYVWQSLLAAGDDLPKDVARADLLGKGAAWLRGRGNTEEWGFVCEILLDQHFQTEAFIDQAAEWLQHTADKPEWPLLAAKFIIAAPHHTASADFAQTLMQRIKACPNKGHWFKTEQMLGPLSANDKLSPAVRNWLQTLQTRRNAPAWAEARRHMEDVVAVKGRVVAVRRDICSLELEIGLMAVWPNADDGIQRFTELERSFFVHKLNPEKEFVQVGTDAPASLDVGGIYEGEVVAKRDNWLLVNLGGSTGLLHHNQCPNWTGLALQYAKGSRIRVEIVALTNKGPQLRYAGPEINVGCNETALAVGYACEATIASLQSYGAFLRVGSCVGLLHRSRLPACIEISKYFTVGQSLRVQVIEIHDDGKVDFALADQ